MQIAAIIQARMSSSRLFGKVLKEVHNKPMLQYLYERLLYCRALDEIIVSTSTDPSDDPVADYCRQRGIRFFRGPLQDVAGRFKATLDECGADAFVRVNGDSPLLDQRLIDYAVALFRDNDCDLVTNVSPRTFPIGQSVEVLNSDSFRMAYVSMTDPQDREHVTRYFYRHKEAYRIVRFSSPREYPPVHLAVDTKADFERFDAIVRSMIKPAAAYSLDDLVSMAIELGSREQHAAA